MTTQQPLVSVIIPVYNVEQYLDECVQSVLTQTYQNVEIILVDDGSTDSSGAMCDQYGTLDARVQVIHKQNGGQSTARNLGLTYAQGTYVYFIDSDDIVNPEAIATLVSIAEKENAQVVFFDAASFLDEDRQKPIEQRYVRKHRYPIQSGMQTFAEMQQQKEYHCVVWGMLLKKDFLISHQIEFIPGVYYEDMAYAYEVLCLADTVAQCSEVLYQHRYRANSTMTSKKSKKYFDSCVTVYRRVKDFSKKIGIEQSDVAKTYIARLAYNVFNNYYQLRRVDQKICRGELKQIKQDILENHSYGDTALRMKCYSNGLWVLYKIYQKITKRF